MKTKIKKDNLKHIFENLKDSHRIIGHKIEGNVVTLGEIDLPYILEDFKYHLASDSFKRFLNPPLQKIFSFKRSKSGITINYLLDEKKPIAFWGMRACDVFALRLLDKVFLEGTVRSLEYDLLRRNAVIIAANCLYPSDNCFCTSMGTGPEAKDGFDIAITELEESFLLEVETPAGEKILDRSILEEVSDRDIDEKSLKIDSCKRRIRKSVNVDDLPWVIYRNLEHPRWADTAKRCFSCGNCTQVCPTCFCNLSFDRLELSTISEEPSGTRVKIWDSCFSKDFARVHRGNFRLSRKARYRHWMSHKFAYWIEQFGMLGCVGCGRCIRWCPAGIDITEELEALRVAK